jgi:signal transduction histidine kinase
MTASGRATRPAVAGRRVALGALLARAARPLVSARTWLAVIHLLSGTVTGAVAFTGVVIGVGAGIGLLPAFLIGIPILWATVWLCARFAAAERARFALLLDVRIAAPPVTPTPAGVSAAGIWRRLRVPGGWRQLGYALLRFPLSLVQAVIVATGWSLAVAMIALPGYNAALPQGGVDLAGKVLRGPVVAVISVIAGLLVLAASPWLTSGLAAVDSAVARRLLGQPGRADLTARIGELERSRADVVDAAAVERSRIERDLHDGAQQRLVALAMELGRAKAKLADDPKAAEELIGEAHLQAKQALAELRNLVRGVHPPVLTDRGLDAALSGVAALCPVPVTLQVDLPARPSATVESIAYFVVAEALTNVAKHAAATRVEVSIDQVGDMLRIAITDDGIGGADPVGQGLAGLAGRLAGVDGRLTVTSPAGGPTRIEAEVPCGS